MNNEKKFLKPDLQILWFEDDLATDIVTSGEGDIEGEDVEYPGGIL